MTNNGIWADKFIKREQLPAGDLAQRFNISNPRTHPESQRQATESSLDTVGWIDEISLSTNGNGPPSLADNPDAVMFDGHERVEIALVRGGPDTLVPVRWYQLTPEETDFALLAKDQTSAMAQIDPAKMAALMERTKAMTGAPGLQGMLERLKEQVADGLLSEGNGAGNDTPPAIDKAAELQEKWGVKVGDLWQLGDHRIVCGDCTDAAVVKRVMGCDQVDLVLVDPPYAVNYGAKNRSLQTIGRSNRLETDIEGDTLDTKEAAETIWKPAFKNAYGKSRNGTVIYCFSPQGGDQMMMMMMIRAEWNDRLHQLIWRKNTPTFSMGRLDYQYQHEPILYSWRGTNHGFYGETGRSIIDCDRPAAAKLHPTMKPLELLEIFIRNSSKINEIVFDCFLGAGSTLIACHNLGRRCRGIEIHPPYVSVCLQRFLDHTGIEPVLLSE